jgi:branched-chain amino acid transport system ATP-binding protein
MSVNARQPGPSVREQDQPVLATVGLSAGYGDERILNSVDTEFRLGQITALVGSNGAGKSTLLKSLFGLTRIFDGAIVLDGTQVRPSARAFVMSGVGYVPQVANVFPTLSVQENLQVGTYVRKGGSIELVLDVFPALGDLMSRPAQKLSGGERNMLAVGRALMSNPRVLLLDEPTGGLAPKLAQEFWHYLVGLAERGIGVVVVEQNVDLAMEFAEYAYVLVDGFVAISGQGKEVAARQDFEEMFLAAKSASSITE